MEPALIAPEAAFQSRGRLLHLSFDPIDRDRYLAQTLEPQRKGMAVTRSFGTPVADFDVMMGAITQYAMRAGDKLRNEPRAVAVYRARDVQIGYLIAGRAPWIGGMIKNVTDIRAIFQGRDASRGSNLRRPRWQGAHSAPALLTKPAQADEDGFWPDEIPPDD